MQAGRGQLAPKRSLPYPTHLQQFGKPAQGAHPSPSPILFIHLLYKEHSVLACPCVPDNVDCMGQPAARE